VSDLAKTVTIGLPLPNLTQYGVDVSWDTRKAIKAMTDFSGKHGITIYEESMKGVNVAHNHNLLANRFVGDWLLVIGSDHSFNPDALTTLLAATEEEPYPKIIGGLCPYRNWPYRYVVTKVDQYRQLTHPIIPYLDFHPGATITGSGEIIEVGTIGSGFCMYHRSVFDTVPAPWFQYAPAGLPKPELESLLRDFDVEMSFPEFLENGAPMTGERAEILKNKAMRLRRALALSRAPVAFGPDYYLCMNAADYGIKSYLHLGVTVFHYDFIPVHPGYYISNLRDKKLWFEEAMKGRPTTVQSVQEVRQLQEETFRLQQMNPEELAVDYAEKTGATIEAGSREETPELVAGA
jgi:hypothetical protein